MQRQVDVVTGGVIAQKSSFSSPRSSGPRKNCAAEGCRGVTNGGKEYCADHIDLMPYVIGLGEGRFVQPKSGGNPVG